MIVIARSNYRVRIVHASSKYFSVRLGKSNVFNDLLRSDRDAWRCKYCADSRVVGRFYSCKHADGFERWKGAACGRTGEAGACDLFNGEQSPGKTGGKQLARSGTAGEKPLLSHRESGGSAGIGNAGTASTASLRPLFTRGGDFKSYSDCQNVLSSP